ncbi:MAG: phosphatidylserine decarboxylase family protein [Bacteroidales bacterium]
MKYIIHKEGSSIIFVAVMLGVFLVYASWVIFTCLWFFLIIAVLALLFIIWSVFFFRVPVFSVKAEPGELLSSADGKVVAIEEVYNDQFPGNKALLISVFMSPFDTHLNRFPMPGKVLEVSYERGKFLPAYAPKSSELNERNTVKMVSDGGHLLWIRQIAGMLARRIVNYAQKGQSVYAGEKLGFIKFGSRVDHFMPADAQVKIKINDKVKAGRSVIASLDK